jgi:DNA-binding transcriptional MocR family regulator
MLCANEGVSLMTALAAYRRLEDTGLVEAIPRSGYRVNPPAGPGPVRAPAVRSRLVAHSRERDDIVNQVLAAVADPDLEPLGLGCPTPDHYPLAALRRRTGQLLAAHPEIWTIYSPPPGDPELRRQIARRLQARGLEVGPAEVLVTTGASEALALAMRVLLAPGEIVAVPCPTFFGILDAARGAGARVLEFPEGPDGAEPAAFLKAAGRTPPKAVALVPSFSNPTGFLMGPERRAEWIEALHRRGVALIEDDLYGDMAFDGVKPGPMMALAKPDGPPCFLVGGFSKTLVPGGRVGFIVARSPWIERLTALKRALTLANATLAERLVAQCLTSGLYERHLRRLVPDLFQSVQALRQQVSRHFPAGTRLSTPRGGFALWVELPEGSDSLRLFHAAAGAGISIAPGPMFSLGHGLERFLRLNGGGTLRREDTLARLGRLAKDSPD